MTKAVAVVLTQPLVQTAKQVLAAMNDYVKKSDFDLQVLEGLVYNLLRDIPVPSPGRSVRFWCLGEAVTLSMPKEPRELPLFDYDLLEFFDILGIENAIKFLTCALLENQTIVYSSDLDKLMLVCECVTGLMYPFSWPHVYVPILPPSLENFLDAPVPYMMGLVRRTHDIELSKRGSVAIVDIDSGELELPEELPEFPHEKELAEEVRENIARFGGKEGVDVLTEHAKETRENLDDNDNNDTMEELNQMISKFESLSAKSKPGAKSDKNDRMRLTSAIREIFVNRFAHMFLTFEHFIIETSHCEDNNIGEEEEEGDDEEPMSVMMDISSGSSTQNFDKTSFLSDQRNAHLPFLSSFLETQAFSTFIDEFVGRPESPFRVRLDGLKDIFGHTPTYETCQIIDDSDQLLMKRLKKVEVTVTPQKNTSGKNRRQQQQSFHHGGVFPLLDPVKFDSKDSTVLVKGHKNLESQMSVVGKVNKISMLEAASPAAIADTNWKFVSQLLKECKSKTKRILLEKLGQEAVEWGHRSGEQLPIATEENMLVASVCDLIERIWSHGLQNRQGKSSLWHFLYKYGRANEKAMKFKGNLGRQAFCIPFLPKNRPFVLPEHSKDVQVVVNPLKSSSTFDSTVISMVHNVSSIREIKVRRTSYLNRCICKLALQSIQQLSKY